MQMRARLKTSLTALVGGALLLLGGAAHADVRVAASSSNMAMLVETIGGPHVEVTTMAPPDRDLHYLEARPSMMAAIRNADLVVSVGAELEEGWLPAAINGANNPEVQPGRSGYFEAAAQVELIGQLDAADRAGGDVHPKGNPHVYLDPVRMAEVGRALAQRLAALEPAHEETFRENARAFSEAVDSRMEQWTAAVEGAPGAVLYHEDANYLLERFDVPIHGFLEPLPGVPPTGRHLRELVRDLRDAEGVILHMSFQPADGARFLARELGWEVHTMENGVPVGGDAEEYFALIDRWIEVLAP